MEYSKVAKRAFQSLVDGANANHCTVLSHVQGTLIDAGWEVPGGWMAAKCTLEGLIGGRGQVSYTHRPMPDGAQLPAVELFVDDPLGMADAFRVDESGIFGVREGEDYALGVTLHSLPQARLSRGNVVCASPNSLFAGVLEAGSLLARAVEAVRAAGITDVQWGWSSCPFAAMTQNEAQTLSRRTDMAQREGVVSLWVRGEEGAIRRAISSFPVEGFTVHELVTAFTYVKTNKISEN